MYSSLKRQQVRRSKAFRHFMNDYYKRGYAYYAKKIFHLWDWKFAILKWKSMFSILCNIWYAIYVNGIKIEQDVLDVLAY